MDGVPRQIEQLALDAAEGAGVRPDQFRIRINSPRDTVTTLHEGVYEIALGTGASAGSRPVQKFFLAHEFGHIVLKHFGPRFVWLHATLLIPVVVLAFEAPAQNAAGVVAALAALLVAGAAIPFGRQALMRRRESAADLYAITEHGARCTPEVVAAIEAEEQGRGPRMLLLRSHRSPADRRAYVISKLGPWAGYEHTEPAARPTDGGQRERPRNR